MEKALKEQPEYVVFNGAVGSLMDDNALSAKVGETVRLFVGNGGPNLVSSFHVIGEIFDSVFVEGGNAENHNVQTTLIPAGGAAIIEFKVEVPGAFILVDHSIFRAFNKGAIGMLKVEGEEKVAIYSGKIDDRIYLPEGRVAQELPGVETKPLFAKTKEERIKYGKIVFNQICAACHQAGGQGIPGAFPPLAASDYLNKDIERAVGVVANGLEGEITVNGQTYNGVMPRPNLSDEDIANVLTYVLNNWNNSGGEITPEQVAKVRQLSKQGN